MRNPCYRKGVKGVVLPSKYGMVDGCTEIFAVDTNKLEKDSLLANSEDLVRMDAVDDLAEVASRSMQIDTKECYAKGSDMPTLKVCIV